MERVDLKEIWQLGEWQYEGCRSKFPMDDAEEVGLHSCSAGSQDDFSMVNLII